MSELLFVANWKMNMTPEGTRGYARAFRSSFKARSDGRVDAVFCPPFTALEAAREAFDGLNGAALGAQNVHWLDSGAHTGEISAPMLKDAGTSFVIVGHSERRQFYGETDEFVAKRAKAALTHGMRPIVCVGESTYLENANEQTYAVVGEQLRRCLSGVTQSDAAALVVAYEPVWAIGTGRAATPDIIHRLHTFIRGELMKLLDDAALGVPLLYGGSTTPENIAAIASQPNVNGALVGSTSLKPESFAALIFNARAAQKVS